MRKIDTIFIHCAATQPDWMADASAYDKREEIDKWHRARGFNGFGYHYLIDRNGETIPGRAEETVGAHVKGHNANSIGICLVGGHGSNENDQFADHFTAHQDAALRELLDDLLARYPDAKVRGHNEVAAKACPGFRVAQWINGRKPVDAVLDDADKPPHKSKSNASALMQLATGQAANILAFLSGVDWKVVAVIAVAGGAFFAFQLWDRERKAKLARAAKGLA